MKTHSLHSSRSAQTRTVICWPPWSWCRSCATTFLPRQAGLELGSVYQMCNDRSMNIHKVHRFDDRYPIFRHLWINGWWFINVDHYSDMFHKPLRRPWIEEVQLCGILRCEDGCRFYGSSLGEAPAFDSFPEVSSNSMSSSDLTEPSILHHHWFLQLTSLRYGSWLAQRRKASSLEARQWFHGHGSS